jgi:hypothetical protein
MKGPEGGRREVHQLGQGRAETWNMVFSYFNFLPQFSKG